MRKTAVIVRSASWLKFDLIASYLQDLRRDKYDFWVLYDNSQGAVKDEAEFRDAFERFVNTFDGPRARLVIDTDASVKQLYNGTNFTFIWQGSEIGWLFHIPFVNAWRYNYETRHYRNYWIVEDDARLSRDNYTEFFDKYARNRADFISGFFANATLPSKVHNWQVPIDRVRRAKEHVQRYSPFLLDELHALHSLGIASVGEYFAATVCHVHPKCTVHSMTNDDVLGTTYLPIGRVPPNRWTTLLRSEPGRWFHALKWLGSRRGLNHTLTRHNIDWPDRYLADCDPLHLCNNEPVYPGMDYKIAVYYGDELAT